MYRPGHRSTRAQPYKHQQLWNDLCFQLHLAGARAELGSASMCGVSIALGLTSQQHVSKPLPLSLDRHSLMWSKKTREDSPWAPGMLTSLTPASTKELQSLGRWIPCSSWSNPICNCSCGLLSTSPRRRGRILQGSAHTFLTKVKHLPQFLSLPEGRQQCTSSCSL